MKIHMNVGGLAQTNAYLLLDDTTRKAALIDAPEGTVADLLSLARREGYDLQYLLLTHGHWDHLSDHAVVTQAFPNAKVLIHRADEPKLEHPGSAMFPLPYTIPPRKADGYLDEGQQLAVGSLAFTIMHTPGHSAGLVCLYCASEKLLFVGDLLMAGSVGRYDLEDGDPALLKTSLRRIMQLPDDTVVLSGHGPETTIGNERNGNPFIRQWKLG